MQIPVLLEPIADGGFQARLSMFFRATAKGSTREEALAKLREKIENRLRKKGAEIVELEVEPAPLLEERRP